MERFIRRSPLRWQFSNYVSRIEVIQRVINVLRGRTYLEIGVSDGACFCSLEASKKIGVDPIPPSASVALQTEESSASYFELSSDAFFEQHAPNILTGGLDVVFIDGLHTYDQSYRDTINSLKYLNPGGLILLHDCLPRSELQARVARNFEDAARLNEGTDWNREWLGDVWKAILRLRSQHSDIQTCVLNCDYGIGIVYKAKNLRRPTYTLAQIENMTFADLAADAKQLLDVHRPSHLFAVLKELKAERCTIE